MSTSESPRVAEAGPAVPQFEIDPHGVQLVVEGAAQKITEAIEAESASPAPGSSRNRMAIAHNIQTAALARRDARLMASTLDLIAHRTDEQPWIDAIEAQANGHQAS